MVRLYVWQFAGMKTSRKTDDSGLQFFSNLEPAYNQHFLDLYQATGFSFVVVVEILRESGSFFHRDPGGHWWEISCQLTKPGRGLLQHKHFND